MKRLPLIVLLLISLAGYGQIQSIHTLVGGNNPNSTLTKRGLDGSLSWTASGTNTYTVNIGLGVTALADGDILKIHFPNANSSTTVTLNVNSIGAIAVKDNAGNDLAVGDIKAGGTYIFRYNGTHFRGLNFGGGGAGTVTAVNGTTDRITSSGGATPTINISATFEALLSKVAQRIDQNNAGTTSAQLATTLSDEVGTAGGFVRATSATLTDPTVITNAATLTDASTIDIAAADNTLSSSSATRTFTISYTGAYSGIIVTLSATSATYTFPATSLCVSEGIPSGDNTLSISGVSGDKYRISIKKTGSNYEVFCKNIGQ